MLRSKAWAACTMMLALHKQLWTKRCSEPQRITWVTWVPLKEILDLNFTVHLFVSGDVSCLKSCSFVGLWWVVEVVDEEKGFWVQTYKRKRYGSPWVPFLFLGGGAWRRNMDHSGNDFPTFGTWTLSRLCWWFSYADGQCPCLLSKAKLNTSAS